MQMHGTAFQCNALQNLYISKIIIFYLVQKKTVQQKNLWFFFQYDRTYKGRIMPNHQLESHPRNTNSSMELRIFLDVLH